MIEINVLNLALASGGLCTLYGLLAAFRAGRRLPQGPARLGESAAAVRDAARFLMKRQYFAAWLAAFAVLGLALTPVGARLDNSYVLGWVTNGILAGALGSALVGWIGLAACQSAGLRTLSAAERGKGAALRAAFGGAAALGSLTSGLALLSVAGFYLLAKAAMPPEVALRGLLGLALGGSLVSLGTRIVGGVSAKGADMGAGLAGSAEPGIEGDDPRNAALVADLAGDTASGGLGMAADLYESAVVVLVAAMLLGKAAFGADSLWVEYPLLLAGALLPATLVGGWLVRVVGRKQRIMAGLYQGLLVAVLLGGGAAYYASGWFLGLPGVEPAIGLVELSGIAVAGLALLLFIAVLAEQQAAPGGASARRIAAASAGGPAASVVAGLAAGLRSAGPLLLVLGAALGLAYFLGGGMAGATALGLFAVALAVVALVSMAGFLNAVNAYGAIADTASGLATLAPPSSLSQTAIDALGAAGQGAKAIARGYATACAVLAAVLLFIAFTRSFSGGVAPSLYDPAVLIALLAGGLLPYVYSALVMDGVAAASGRVAEEVRRQLREVPGVLESSAAPAFARGLEAAAQGAVRHSLAPLALPLLIPAAVGVWAGRDALVALLVGCVLVGLLQALSWTGSGAADGARRCIEQGRFGGRRSASHHAALVGDAVGDACKDAAGPALNPMLKAACLVSLLLLPVLG
jgi:K(+)-stimulated pyrophosphate-energized sodium pump